MASPGPLNWRNEVSRHSQVTEIVMNYSPHANQSKRPRGAFHATYLYVAIIAASCYELVLSGAQPVRARSSRSKDALAPPVWQL